MQQVRSKELASVWWQVALLVVVSLAAVIIGLRYDQTGGDLLDEARYLPSIFNKKQTGLTALNELVKQSGMKTEPWESPYRELKSCHGLLVTVGPMQVISDAEFAQILKWVESGNQFVYLDSFNTEGTKQFAKQLEIKIDQAQSISDKLIKPNPKIAETEYVPFMVISSRARLHGGTAIVSDDYGPILTETRLGAGRILLGALPTLCSNRSITDTRYWPNFQFLLNWFSTASGTIYFDERCHGFSGSANVFVFLLRSWLGPVCAQLLILLLVAIVSAHQRFGQIQKINTDREISSLEFINGLGSAYERSRASFAALEIIFLDFKSAVCRLLSISPHSKNVEIISAVKLVNPQGYSNLEKFLTDYELLSERKNISVAELVEQVKRCDALTEEMQKEFAQTRA